MTCFTSFASDFSLASAFPLASLLTSALASAFPWASLLTSALAQAFSLAWFLRLAEAFVTYTILKAHESRDRLQEAIQKDRTSRKATK